MTSAHSCHHAHIEMYLELAEQKEEEARRKQANAPKERDYEQEHREAIEKER